MAHHETLTNAEIAQLYAKRPSPGHSRVMKISDQAIVKAGWFVSEEAANIRMAAALLDQNIVKLPKIYRLFDMHGTSYLVMEYINGRNITKDDYPAVADRMF